MDYQSTRGGERGVSPSLAIVKGLAADGGLFVPDSIPKLSKSLRELSELSYQDLAYEMMKLYLTDFTEEELRFCIRSAYDDKFDCPEIAPVVKHWHLRIWLCRFYRICLKSAQEKTTLKRKLSS